MTHKLGSHRVVVSRHSAPLGQLFRKGSPLQSVGNDIFARHAHQLIRNVFRHEISSVYSVLHSRPRHGCLPVVVHRKFGFAPSYGSRRIWSCKECCLVQRTSAYAVLGINLHGVIVVGKRYRLCRHVLSGVGLTCSNRLAVFRHGPCQLSRQLFSREGLRRHGKRECTRQTRSLKVGSEIRYSCWCSILGCRLELVQTGELLPVREVAHERCRRRCRVYLIEGTLAVVGLCRPVYCPLVVVSTLNLLRRLYSGLSHFGKRPIDGIHRIQLSAFANGIERALVVVGKSHHSLADFTYQYLCSPTHREVYCAKLVRIAVIVVEAAVEFVCRRIPCQRRRHIGIASNISVRRGVIVFSRHLVHIAAGSASFNLHIVQIQILVVSHATARSVHIAPRSLRTELQRRVSRIERIDAVGVGIRTSRPSVGMDKVSAKLGLSHSSCRKHGRNDK